VTSALEDKVEAKITKKNGWGGARPNTGGKRPGSGRKKGTPNKVTADVKDAILKAFGDVGRDQYLKKVAQDDPRVFCALLGRVLPIQHEGNPENPLVVQNVPAVDRPPKETREEWEARRNREVMNGHVGAPARTTN